MVFIKRNSLNSDIYFNHIFIPCFSGSRFLGSRFFRVRVQVLEVTLGFSESRFFRVRVQVSEVPLGFSGSRFILVRFFRVRVQRKDPGFRSSRKYLLDLIKRRSEVQGKNMSCERALNFYQREFDCGLLTNLPIIIFRWRFFSEFIQTQKRYPTLLTKCTSVLENY